MYMAAITAGEDGLMEVIVITHTVDTEVMPDMVDTGITGILPGTPAGMILTGTRTTVGVMVWVGIIPITADITVGDRLTMAMAGEVTHIITAADMVAVGEGQFRITTLLIVEGRLQQEPVAVQ